jgi:hypothetical protein
MYRHSYIACGDIHSEESSVDNSEVSLHLPHAPKTISEVHLRLDTFMRMRAIN